MARQPPTPEDKQLAVAAARKKQAGQTVPRHELRALTKVQRYQEEQDRWKHYASIPKGHYVQLAGRQNKVLDDQARRYGLPLLGESIDLASVLTRFHDLLRDHGHKITADEDETTAGPNSPALERLRDEKAKIARMERMELQRQLLPRQIVRRSLQVIASQINSLGEDMQRQFGIEALRAVTKTVDAIQRQLEDLIGDGERDDDKPETPPPDAASDP
jgi:phage terminase Nu1 subunit (DNA packaging protein)